MENPNIPFYQPQSRPAGTPMPPQANVEVKVDVPQVIEKIVYKKQRIHGFFRTLTIIALLVVGVLMLLENTGVMKLSIANLDLDLIYPVIVIFSTIVIRSYRGIFGKLFGLILFLGVVGGFFGISTYTSLNPSTKSKFGDTISYAAPGTYTTGIMLSQININTLIGNIDLVGKDIIPLVEGTYKSDRALLVTSGVKTNYDYLRLKEDPHRNVLQNYSTDLNAAISDTKIVDLYVKNLLGRHTINLEDMQRYKTWIHGGVQDLTVILGEKVFKDSELDIQLVGGKIAIYVPKNIGIQLHFKQLAGSLELTNFDIKEKGYFESKNIATAKKIVKINVNAGVSLFKLLWK